MDIPLNAEVRCADRFCGTSVGLVFNPVTDEVTHIVVKEKKSPEEELLVPLDIVIRATPQHIELRDTAETLEKMEPFIQTQFLRVERPYTVPAIAAYNWPYVLAEGGPALVPMEYERIPVGEEAVRRGAEVHATDGVVGKIDEFVVDPECKHITHLVLREGHLWGQRDVTIPVTQIARIEENAVYLNLTKSEIGKLPSVPIRR
jgi:sporulation protein YlmC with PRC-barrel domain